MTRQRLEAIVLILIGAVFALAPLLGTLSNAMVWLAAALFVGLGGYQLIKTFKK